MPHLTPHDVMTMFMALARVAGLRQTGGGVDAKDRPALNPGRDFRRDISGTDGSRPLPPHIYQALFPTTGPMPIVLDTVTTLGVVFFLLTAGLEIDLRSIFRQGKSALLVSLLGVAFPLATGFLAASVFPQYLGAREGASPLIFAMFGGGH